MKSIFLFAFIFLASCPAFAKISWTGNQETADTDNSAENTTTEPAVAPVVIPQAVPVPAPKPAAPAVVQSIPASPKPQVKEEAPKPAVVSHPVMVAGKNTGIVEFSNARGTMIYIDNVNGGGKRKFYMDEKTKIYDENGQLGAVLHPMDHVSFNYSSENEKDLLREAWLVKASH